MLTQRLPATRRVVGVDISPALLAAARNRLPAESRAALACADFHHLPLADATCDVVVAAFCVYHSAVSRRLRQRDHSVPAPATARRSWLTKSADGSRKLKHLVAASGLDPLAPGKAQPVPGRAQRQPARPRVRAPAGPAGRSPCPPVHLREPGSPPSTWQPPPKYQLPARAGRRSRGTCGCPARTAPGSLGHRDIHRHLPGRHPARDKAAPAPATHLEALPRRRQSAASRTELSLASQSGWPDAPALAARRRRPASGLRARQRRARSAQ